MKPFYSDLFSFGRFLIRYLNKKVIFSAFKFESLKNILVDVLMFKRGVMQKKVWHSSVITLSAFGIITSGIFGGQTIISATFPGVVEKDPRFPANFDPEVLNDPVLNSFYDTKTVVSEKPRAEIIEYEVQSGDTISGVADKFDV